jgi:hypothetical protein
MLGSLIKGALGPILDGVLKLIPDKNARSEAKEQFEGQMLTAMTSLVEGQLRINMKEAEHGSIFVAGWRPAIGWICGFALAWSFILQPIGSWVVFMFGVDIEGIPTIELGPLLSILLGMLGLGGLRTYEKRLGVARTGVKNGGN